MKQLKYIICIIGQTGTGKDTFAKNLRDTLGIPILCSYTTRKIRDSEEDGREHWFISKEKMEELKKSPLLGYTINDKTGIEYCLPLEALEGSRSNRNIYIINPNGLRYLYYMIYYYHLSHLRIFTIFLHHPGKDFITDRVLKRGDDYETFDKRYESERIEFQDFEESKLIDHHIHIDSDDVRSEEEVKNFEMAFTNKYTMLRYKYHDIHTPYSTKFITSGNLSAPLAREYHRFTFNGDTMKLFPCGALLDKHVVPEPMYFYHDFDYGILESEIDPIVQFHYHYNDAKI